MRYYPIILLAAAVYLFFLAFHTIGLINSVIFSPKFIIIFISIIIGSIFIIGVFKTDQTLKKIIEKETLKSNINEIETPKGKYYFVGFKIDAKKIPPDSEVEIDPIGEIYEAIDSVYRHGARQINVVVVTLLEPKAGSAVIFYSKAGSWSKFATESLNLKYMIMSLAPNLKLEPVSLKTNPVFPIPETIDTGNS